MDEESDNPNWPAPIHPPRPAASGRSGGEQPAFRRRASPRPAAHLARAHASPAPEPPRATPGGERPAGEERSVGLAAWPTDRRLAALAFLDVADYARLMGADEAATLRRWVDQRGRTIEPLVARWRGRVVDRAGDGLFVEFRSVLDAVRWAFDVQAALAVAPAAAEEPALPVRVAVHLGDVLDASDGGVYGDAVNVAARLQERAAPGGVVVSRAVHEQVRHLLAYAADDLGPLALKNIGRPVHAFRVGQTAPAQRGDAPFAASEAPTLPAGAATAALAGLLGAVAALSAVAWPSGAAPGWAVVSALVLSCLVARLALARPRRQRV